MSVGWFSKSCSQSGTSGACGAAPARSSDWLTALRSQSGTASEVSSSPDNQAGGPAGSVLCGAPVAPSNENGSAVIPSLGSSAEISRNQSGIAASLPVVRGGPESIFGTGPHSSIVAYPDRPVCVVSPVSAGGVAGLSPPLSQAGISAVSYPDGPVCVVLPGSPVSAGDVAGSSPALNQSGTP